MKGQNKEQPTYYYGTQANFDGFVANQTLVKGRIYFIVKAKTYAKGFIKADDGVIYVATSASTYVRFGSFSTEDDIDEIVRRLDGRIDDEILARSQADTALQEQIDGKVAKTDIITDAEIEAMDAEARNGHFLDNWGLKTLWNKIVSFFVQKEDGKGLSSNDYTDSEKSKLAGIAQGAEVNVQSDWNQTDTSADDYIKNKPSVYTQSEIDTKLADKQDILTLPLPVNQGGTGATTATEAEYNILSKASTYLSEAVSDDNWRIPYISASPSTSNGRIVGYKLPSQMWNYIKGKADAVYSNKKHTHGLYVSSSQSSLQLFRSQVSHQGDAETRTGWMFALTDEELADNEGDNSTRNFLRVTRPGANGNDCMLNNYSPSLFFAAQDTRAMISIYPYSPIVKMFGGNGKLSKLPNWDLTIKGTSGTTITFPIAGGTLVNTTDIAFKVNYYNILLRHQNSYDSKIVAIDYDTNYENRTVFYDIYARGTTNELYEVFSVTGYANGTGLRYRLHRILGGNNFTMNIYISGTTIYITNKSTEQNIAVSIVSKYKSLTVGYVSELPSGVSEMNYINQDIRSLNVSDTETANKAVTAVSETDGKIAVTRRTIGSIGEAVSFTQSSYDAQHSATNEYQKVLTLEKGDSCVLNITKVVYGSPIQTTIWLSNGNNVDFSMLKECAGLVTTGGGSGQSVTLLIPVVPQQGYPHATLKIHVVRQTDDDSLTFHNSSPEYVVVNHPRKPAIVMRDEISNDAVTFNITSGTGSVSLADSFDFIGNVTDSSTSAGITVTNYEQGQCYRFTFTEELEGVTLYSSNSVALCTVNETIQKGDVLTFTSVSNTDGGWMYSKTGASIKSSDGSVNIEWENGVADLKVERIPENIVKNVAAIEWENDKNIAIGYQSKAIDYSGDDNNPYASTSKALFYNFKVDNGSNVKHYQVTAGTTYSVSVVGRTESFTPTVSGNLVCINTSTSSIWFQDNKHQWGYRNYNLGQSGSLILIDAMNVYPSSYQYIIGVVTISESIIDDAATILYVWMKSRSLNSSLAIGRAVSATGDNSICVGKSLTAIGDQSVIVGYNNICYGVNSIIIGYNARLTENYSVAIGSEAYSYGTYGTAIGYGARAFKGWSTALGAMCIANADYGCAIGYGATSTNNYTVSVGVHSKAVDTNSVALGPFAYANKGIAIGRYARAAYETGDANLPYYKAKRFTAVEFTVGGDTKLVIMGTYGVDVTISVNGTQKTVTPPSSSQLMLCVVNDSSASVMGKFVSDYPTADGKVAYCPNMSASSVSVDNITGNYYAVWFRCDNNQSHIDVLVNASTFSFLAYYKTNATSYENFAIGYESYALCNGIAIGRGAVAIRNSQIVIGNYSIPDEDAMLIIGNGISGNTRKNILTIDSNENLHVRKVHEDGIYYCGSAGLQNIVMGDAIYVSGVADQYIDLPENNVTNGTSFRFIAKYACKIRQGWTVIADMAQGTFKDFVFLDGTWYVS